MPHLRNFFSKKTFSIVLVTLLSLSTVLPLTKESLPASSASNILVIQSTITSGATDYAADTPSSGPLLTSGDAATYYIDLRNSAGSSSTVENIILKTKDLTSWTGTPICQFVTGGALDHTVIDFDGTGASCTLDGDYNISGVGFPSSLVPGDGVYVRITGLNVGSSTISMTATVNANFISQTTFTSKNAAYARVGDIVITGHVFKDLDGNSINNVQDVDYVGLGITLIQETPGNGSGIGVGSNNTDENGYYSFNELDTPGLTTGQDYRVSILATSDRLTTGNNIQQFFGITSGTYVTTDMGFHIAQLSLVGNRVWYDTNQDGIQDPSETIGVAGNRLRLFDANTDTALDTTTSGSIGDYKVGHDPLNPQCFGRNINQAGGSLANTTVSYTCQVQAGGHYYLTLRTDFYCSVDQSAFRLYDAGNNLLTEGSCGRSGYPTNMEPKHSYTFGPFDETQAGMPHLDVIDGYGDFTFSDVNWEYTGPIGYDAYVVIDQIDPSYQISPADQTDDSSDSDITSTLPSGTEYRTDNFFFQLDNFNQTIDVGLYGPPPASTDLTINKTAFAPTTAQGDTVTYTITVTNTDSATAVVVHDMLPAALTYSSSTPSVGSYSVGSGDWTIGDMASNGSETLTIDAVISDVSSTITNIASVSSNTLETNSADNTDSVDIIPTAPPPALSADLLLDKTATATDPQLGSTIVYDITVTNLSSTTTAADVIVTDVLPAAVSFSSQSASAGTYVPGTSEWTIGDIAPGDIATLSIEVSITDDSAKIYNTASVSSSTFDPTLSNNSDTVSTTPSTPPPPSTDTDLLITKSVAVSSSELGGTVTYTISVQNQSLTTTATDVVVTDMLPSALTFVSQSATTGSYNDGTSTWTIGSMGAGTTEELTITTTINDDSSEIFNTASVTCSTTDPTPLNNSDTVSFTPTGAPPSTSTDLGITKTVDAPTPLFGSTATYTITVANLNAITTATGVTVNDMLPSSVTYVTQTATTGTYDDSSGIWAIGTMLPSATATLTITTIINDDSRTINNTATVSSGSFDPVSINNASTASFTPSTPPPPASADLSILKTATAPDPQLGGTIVYEVTVTNNSIATASNGIIVMDTLPSGVHFEGATLSTGTLVASMWSIGTLAPSSSAVMTITVTITDATSPITNTASVFSVTTDPVPANNSSSATILPITPSPSPTPTATPSPTPSVTSTPTPTPSSTSNPGTSGGGIISPPGITVVNGGGSSGGSSGWHYSGTDSPARSSSGTKQAQIAQPAVPPAPTQDPIMCLQTNSITALNFSDIAVTTDQTKAQFLTSILNRGTNTRLIQGYNAQTYGIGKVLTRFELTKIALESNCLQSDQLYKNTVFSDVPHDNSEMSVIIGTAQALGIVNGKDGKFYPNQAVTYAEMSKILLGSGFYFQQHSPAITYTASFPGITDESFRQYAEYAVRLELVSLDNGSFPQNRPIYRDTMLQVLTRYISYLKNITIAS
jgi:uncharacterized repeat protein (TIGR01451 family)